MGRRGLWLDDVLRDVRWAVRSVRRRPGPSAVVITTLAIAVGASAATFTVVNRILLRPLPYEAARELAMVFRTIPQFGLEYSAVSYPDFADWRSGAESFADMAAFAPIERTLATPEGAREWAGTRVTANLFTLLGIAPRIGRGLTADDDVPGAPPVMVISDALFRSHFGSDVAALGDPVTLDDRLVRVVGVMPPDFAFPTATTAFWEPLRPEPAWQRGDMFLRVIGRLAPGRSVDRAQTELAGVAARIDGSAADAIEGLGLRVESRHAYEVRQARTALWVFLGGVFLLLAVACANITNVQLSRAVTRRSEIGVRGALGAGRSRIARQFLVENLLLAVMGGALGLAVAWGLLEVMLAFAPPGLPRVSEIRLDGWMLLFTGLASLLAGVAFGALPALWGARQSAGRTVRDGGAGSGRSPRVVRVQETFASVQIAFAVALSIGAGLLLQSFSRLLSVEPGFDPTGVLVAKVEAPRRPAGGVDPGPETATAERDRFWGQIRDGLEGGDGVMRTALAYVLPFGPAGMSRSLGPDGADASDEPAGIAGNIVSPSYFRTMGIPLLAGREFTDLDEVHAPRVAIVNATLAAQFWPGESAVGKRLYGGDGGELQVVGLVADVRQRNLGESPKPFFYTPLAQEPGPDAVFLVVRSALPTADLAARIRREVAAVDPGVPVTELTTSAALIDRSIASPRFRTLVVTTYGLMGLILAVIGVYGVLSHAVGERRREMGIRMALGAGAARIVGMILGRGLRLAVAGVLVGIVGALALTRFLSTMLFGVQARDPAVFALTAVVALGVTLAACCVPARRASRVDPLRSLRHE